MSQHEIPSWKSNCIASIEYPVVSRPQQAQAGLESLKTASSSPENPPP
jgi:hypothetical protein